MWLDETAGVAWELREIKRKEHLRKLVLLSLDRNGRPMAEEKARRAIFDLGLDGRFTDCRALLYYYEVEEWLDGIRPDLRPPTAASTVTIATGPPFTTPT